jgi:hypothetical protein
MGTGSPVPLDPIIMSIVRAQISQLFPMIANDFDVTSSQTEDYNCIAWAANDTENWWWPTNPDRYWPQHVSRRESIDSFVEAFRTLGYEPCDSGLFETGFEKVAIYCISGVPKHMARQLSSGRWTSKLGPQWDICHHTLNGLTGAIYGIPAQIMKRPGRVAQV